MNAEDELDIPVLIEHPPTTGETPPSRVPLTIICGFLGAGKSTLLKRILTERHGYRIAVIMNEFGDTADIEAKTINVSSPDDPTAEQSEEFLELANGCLCCSIKDLGVAAIEKLMQRKGAFDHILLETTGLADPGPIASMFWQNEEFAIGLGRDISLDGVVCVVDAVFGKTQMEEDHTVDTIGESLRQIAGSDVILLNKADLVEPKVLHHTKELIQKVNPVAPVHTTVKGDVDLKHILGIAAFASPPQIPAPEPHRHDHDHEHEHEHGATEPPTHYELRGISSIQVSCPVLSPARFTQLDEWIRTVLWEGHLPGGDANGLQVLRCKGMFATEAGERYVLQGVRSMYEIAKVEDEPAMGVPDAGKVVLIGKGLTEDVRRSLEGVVG
ncbi:CobW/HypB/UreG, nucleotide-binding domain-containing protein [Infundibulicybe gibba]|nr:CobW/HypB/UreG, nucleotide-binding domain-containing protein [Infundibulicybe gibba]